MENDMGNPKPELRPVISRLREIERKCASMGSRSEEFPEMQKRVAGIIERLESGKDASGEGLDYGLIARELFPVAHLFESTGFMSVGKEIAHIERSLNELAPQSGPSATSNSRTRTATPSSSSAARLSIETSPEKDIETPVPRSVPLPIVFGILLLVAVAAGSTAVILGIGPFARPTHPEFQVTPVPAMTAIVVPTATTVLPKSATDPPAPVATKIPRGRLAGEVASARLALAKSDLDNADTHLAEAARIDRTDADVIEIASEIVGKRIIAAYDEAGNARWRDANNTLERAERTAMRFGIETASIEEAREYISKLERFIIVGPGDRRTILRSIGLRVDVTLTDGRVLNGRIEAIDDKKLVLDINNQVGGGIVRYSEDISWSSIRSIKIFEN